MAKDEQKPMTREELLAIIEQARRENWEVLDLSSKGITELPPEIGQLKNLKKLNLGNERYTSDELKNKLTQLPDEIGQLTSLRRLYLRDNQLTALPESIGQLTSLRTLNLGRNQFTAVPESIGRLTSLNELALYKNQLSTLQRSIGQLTGLRILDLNDNKLTMLPEFIGHLTNLQLLILNGNQLTALPDSLDQLTSLRTLVLRKNQLTSVPAFLARLNKLKQLLLDGNPLNPALKSAYKQGPPSLKAYLRSLEQAEPLYETKLLLVGEGDVGKTTLLNALTGKEPKLKEPSTLGVSIDIHSIKLPHPEKQGVNIQFNAWDFGGQEVYRVTHQFFFSKRSVYLLLWEPRMGVQQCQVEDWLKLIRLRVGDDAKVIIVSTHAQTGERIARIDKPVFLRDYGAMIVDFIEVDSLEPDPQDNNERFGLVALKQLIANAAQKLEHMGMDFGKAWKEARDELIELGQANPHVAYAQFAAVCEKHGLESIGTRTLAGIMHDLGYIVYYDDDERLAGDVILQPEWLTKAIGLVLKDRKTQEMDGILPDNRLREVWFDHPFKNEPKYPTELYPFFLRLMEKHDVSYRLESGEASLVAQHVPQVRPALPWLAEEKHHPKDGNPCKGRFRIDALGRFKQRGMSEIPCQTCYEPQNILDLLYGFEEENPREQLVRIETKLDRGFEEMRREFEGLESRVANYVMAILQAIASESKDGPRPFNIIATEGNWHAERFRLHLWCEVEGCSHPVLEEGKGVYEFEATREWIKKIAPYANFIAGVLKTLLPMVAPAVNTFWGEKTIEKLELQDELDRMKEGTGNLLKDIKISDPSRLRQHLLSEAERSGVLALHAFLREVDPHHEKLGLKRIPTYTGDYLWLCEKHYEQSQSKIPDKIE